MLKLSFLKTLHLLLPLLLPYTLSPFSYHTSPSAYQRLIISTCLNQSGEIQASKETGGSYLVEEEAADPLNPTSIHPIHKTTTPVLQQGDSNLVHLVAEVDTGMFSPEDESAISINLETRRNQELCLQGMSMPLYPKASTARRAIPFPMLTRPAVQTVKAKGISSPNVRIHLFQDFHVDRLPPITI